MGQKKLEDKNEFFLGADTDELLKAEDRRADLCHFSESGQLKAAEAYAEAKQEYCKSL